MRRFATAAGAGMPDATAKRSLTLDRATLEVERALRTSLGFAPARLTTAEIRSTYPTRRFVRGWRVRSTFTDGEERRIDVLLPPIFPAGFPRTALVDRPEHMTWPHVERDGVLCLLPVMAEVDSEDPGAVAVQLLGRSARLVEEMLAGDIVDRDFREEFLTYWFYGSDREAPRVTSIVSTDGGTRIVRAWRDGKGLVVVSEDDASLARWLRNWRGEPDGKSYRTEPAALIRLLAPPVPAEYPSTGADLLAMARAAGSEAAATLEAAAAQLPNDLLVLIAAEGRGGPGLVAATTTSARPVRGRSGRIEKPVTKGFREVGMTDRVASMRTFSSAPVLRSVVARRTRSGCTAVAATPGPRSCSARPSPSSDAGRSALRWRCGWHGRARAPCTSWTTTTSPGRTSAATSWGRRRSDATRRPNLPPASARTSRTWTRRATR